MEKKKAGAGEIVKWVWCLLCTWQTWVSFPASIHSSEPIRHVPEHYLVWPRNKEQKNGPHWEVQGAALYEDVCVYMYIYIHTYYI